MTFFIKKLHVAITALVLATAGQIYAGSTACGECEETCVVSSSCGCIRGFVSADLLYWRAHQEGFTCLCTPSEINNFVNEDGTVISRLSGHSKDPHFKWNPGFRIGTGYEFESQNLDVGVYWTHFHTHADGNHQSCCNKFRWKLDYDVVDIIVGRKICLDCINIRPFIGVRVAQIDQKTKSSSFLLSNTFFETGSSSSSSSFSSSFSNSGNTAQSSEDGFVSQEKNKEKYKGVGPLIGIEADWRIGNGFSLYAIASVSSLYGHFSIDSKGESTLLNATNRFHQTSHPHSCQISTDAGIGIRWQQFFCGNREVFLQLGLEEHRYFNHNHLGGYGDLCVGGVSFAAGVSF